MAIENGTHNVELAYLLDPAFQIEGLNGKPVIGGWLNVYEAGTDTKVITYQDFEGSRNPFNIKLGSDGRAVILADPSITYDVYAFDSYGNQIFSRLNVQCNVPGTINLSGADTRINNTDGTLDISLRTLGNNVRQYTINTHNKVLDVQSPLYFVENSETATVIGFDQSGNYIQKDYLADFVTSSISGKADTTAVNDEFTNVHNDITAISSTVSALPTFTDVESGDDAVKSWVTDQDYATRDEVSAYTKRTDFDAAVESINSNKLDVSAYRAQSGNFLQSADLADYYKKTETSSKNELNDAFDNKLDKSESANYYPMTGNPSGFLTEHQSLAALMSASKLEYNGNGEISAYDGSAFAGQGGAGDPEVNELVHSNSATWNDVSAKLDTTAFSTVSGDFLTAHQDISDLMPKSESANFYPMTGNPSGFLTAHQDLSDYQTTAGMTAYQPAGSYLTADALDNVSANWNEVSAKLDTTAFSDVSGSFLTAHQDISNKLDTTAFSDVSGSFLTAVPDTYLQNTDLTIVDNKITEISGVPLSAGDELPSGVMNTSALEYNAVNEISGYNGSAIAQYGAEKQWLQHDDTLVHAANSAQYALGVNLSAVAQLLGVDETVLWENNNLPDSGYNGTVQLSEEVSSFKEIDAYYFQGPASRRMYGIQRGYVTANSGSIVIGPWAENTTSGNWFRMSVSFNKNSATFVEFFKNAAGFNVTGDSLTGSYHMWGQGNIWKIVGIGRKEV